jgi:hypothetical protein
MRSKLLFVLTLASGALMLNSCSKDKSTTTANIFITANINGAATTFNTNAGATTATVSGQTFTTIIGQAKDGTTLSIMLVNNPTSGKVYSDAASNDDDKPLIMITPPGTNADSYLNDDDNTSTLPTVTITSLTSTTITGTFSGLVEGGIPIGNSNTLPTDAITSGKFSLKYYKTTN